jgi:hypothetical protein
MTTVIKEINMHIKTRIMQPRESSYQCECGSEMPYTGIEGIEKSEKINPDGSYNERTIYQHRCPGCGYTIVLPVKYPFIEYVPV